MSTKTTGKPGAPLILGSSSRYRRELLQRLRIPFDVVSPAIDEAALPHEAPRATALRLALAKASAIVARFPNALVIGSDQVADADGIAVGKPGSHAGAIAQLHALSGRTVVFHTALALVNGATGRTHSEVVDVVSTFRTLQADEIADYVAREKPYDCAGSVKSEGLGIALFAQIRSDDPTALVGLPLIALTRMLRAEGVAVLAPKRTDDQ
jgi:septum formation protein